MRTPSHHIPRSDRTDANLPSGCVRTESGLLVCIIKRPVFGTDGRPLGARFRHMLPLD